MALHEDEGTVGGQFLFSTLRDGPTLFLVVLDVAVVSGNSLQLDLDLSLHGSSNREVVGLVGLKDDLFLDEVLILVGADPSWTRSQSWWVLSTIVNIFFHAVIISCGSHDEEGRRWLRGWLACMGDFVEVVVDDLAQVNESVSLDLNRSVNVVKNLFAFS